MFCGFGRSRKWQNFISPTVSDVIIFPMESATMPEAWGPKEILHLDFLVVFLFDVI